MGSHADDFIFFYSWSFAVTSVGRQTSPNLEERIISITRTVGSSVKITCDVRIISSYIYWYRFQEGRTPQYLLSYNIISSTTVVDSGLSLEKYHVYEGTDKTYKFVLRNVEESDAGLYYCAIWTGTMIQPCHYLYWNISLQLSLGHKQTSSPLPSYHSPPLFRKGHSVCHA